MGQLPNRLGPSHHKAPGTSKRAAVDNYPHSGTQRANVFLTIARHVKGLTDEQTGKIMGLALNSVRPRRQELEKGGWVRLSGEERPTDSGSAAKVWIVTGRGWRLAQQLSGERLFVVKRTIRRVNGTSPLSD